MTTETLPFAATHVLWFKFFHGWIQGLGASALTPPIRLLPDKLRGGAAQRQLDLNGRVQRRKRSYRRGDVIAPERERGIDAQQSLRFASG